MRIIIQQQKAFIDILSTYNFQGELYLYGSRVDDTAKGGDIDLLVCVQTAEQRQQLASHKHEILADIKLLIGDQKIDLCIATYEATQTDPFLQIILPDAKLLHQWS